MKSKTEYAVVYEWSGKNWGAYAPDVPGCVAVADTRGETEQLMREAMALHFAAMREDRLPLPEAHAEVGYINVPVITRRKQALEPEFEPEAVAA